MEELRYPIGIQTFPKIIEEGYVYVDKTHYIPLILKHGQFIFLSRPRRFGKSLFLSTLKAFFEGRRSLFKGLSVDQENTDWTPYPVLYFDFNTGSYLEQDGLQKRLDASLSRYEFEYGIEVKDHSVAALPLRFEALILKIYATVGRKVVILVDEYDKPLLELSEGVELFVKNQKILKSFFSNLKSMDEYIRFAFLTGVARFSKVSIFSDLNNLDDISMEDDFADICGLTETELLNSFKPGIKKLAAYLEEDYDDTLSLIRDYYDGYQFCPTGSRLYNPFSVLKALKKKSVEPYWFDSGTPTFLVERMRAGLIDPLDINQRRCSKRQLMQVSLTSKDPIPLMFQTGYLTIDTYDSRNERFTLRFPNREVEKAFADLKKYICYG